MALKKLFIANRGEIAVRIIRAARQLGIATVQAHSSADADMLAVKIADEAVEVGPPSAAKSYLNIPALINAAKATGCDSVHPGYGFLAENAGFAQAVADAGLIFVGPSADVISKMGDKVAAREAAKAAGVPTVPGSEGRVPSLEEGLALAKTIGFPVIIKAAAGGGGRGIRFARDADEFSNLFAQASGEALAAFGDGGLYVEKVIDPARHVEVQVLGDGKDAIHIFERECSLQRRRQKVWEEAPSAAIDHDVRTKLCQSAVDLTKAVNYSGAGTVEYLYDDTTGAFYFIEMNTRIQVEHPVSEMITGVDLVGEMLRIAGGTPLRYPQEEIVPRGHAIEVRLNAENPAQNFLPAPGTIERLESPGGPGVRFDTMLYQGYTVPPFYDSLLGKLIVHGEDREAALQKLKTALHELKIEGLHTTAPLFTALLDAPDVQSGNVTITWLETWLETHANT
ncbi:MAG: acetyl-CoA carboxylase biotin carboxylase subunit [Pseudomonadota bacterium]